MKYYNNGDAISYLEYLKLRNDDLLDKDTIYVIKDDDESEE